MKNKLWTGICVIVLIFFYASKCEEAVKDDSSSKPKEKISCIICSKDLTNDYNRISPNGKGYYCTPCYKQTMRDVNSDIKY